MRSALPRKNSVPDHLGLAYDVWAPIGPGGKVPEADRDGWLQKLAKLPVSPHYALAFARWKSSFGRPGDLLADLDLENRLLVGHGNSSATGVGLTVHHTWGVPVIPGAALKGLLAHYVDAVYGPDDPTVAPWLQPQAERAPFQGVAWKERRIQRGPGEAYRALFGAPDAEEDAAARELGHGAGAAAGRVIFHDALYVPGSIEDDTPFAADVLTVHQRSYYEQNGSTWPNDYDSPNPVAFLTVRPRVRLLLALSGPPDWTDLAARLLADALQEWGIGGKTSAGYGMGKVGDWRSPPPPKRPASETLARFLAWLDAPPPEANGEPLSHRQILQYIEEIWLPRLDDIDAQERTIAASVIRKKIKPRQKLASQRDDLLARLTTRDA